MDQSKNLFNPIGFLNEFCQKNKVPFPTYTIVNREGPAHSPNFSIECVFKDKSFNGQALTIKEAKEIAALKAIHDFNLRECKDAKPSFKIVECSDLECVWNGSSEFKVTFRRKDEKSQQFKTFLFSKIAEIETDEDAEESQN